MVKLGTLPAARFSPCVVARVLFFSHVIACMTSRSVCVCAYWESTVVLCLDNRTVDEHTLEMFSLISL